MVTVTSTVKVSGTPEITLSFDTRAEALLAQTGSSKFIQIGDLRYTADPSGTALTTGDLRTWSPIGEVYAEHFPTGVGILQAAVDHLPSTGGTIRLYSDFSGSTVPTVADRKTVTWVLEPGAVLPSGTPGAVIDSGLKDQPHAGGLGQSTRPGVAFQNITARHQVQDDQPNQQDSIVNIEGLGVDPGSAYTTEFAGLRINMRAPNYANDGDGVRGLHITATGDQGAAKLRSLRTISIGLDGHDGLVNGALISAVRTGVIPTSAGGNGVDEYASGDAGPYPNEDSVLELAVGPGIKRVLKLGGQEGQERPQNAILQNFGAQALLPENAVILLHGGGNGDIIQIARDETDAGDLVAAWEKDGRIFAQAFRSNEAGLVIADDAATSIALPQNGGKLFVRAQTSSTVWAEFFFRAIAGSEVATNIAKGTAVDLTTGPLTGTTGTDTKVTMSIDDQTLVIENRIGASLTFHWAVIG